MNQKPEAEYVLELRALKAENEKLKMLNTSLELRANHAFSFADIKYADEIRALNVENEKLNWQIKNSSGYELGRRAVEVTENALHEAQHILAEKDAEIVRLKAALVKEGSDLASEVELDIELETALVKIAEGISPIGGIISPDGFRRTIAKEALELAEAWRKQ
jgi:hypothetical protein